MEESYTPEQIEKKTKLFKNREFFNHQEFKDKLNNLIQQLVHDLTTIDEHGCVTSADPYEVGNRLANSKVLQRLALQVVYDHEASWISHEATEKLDALAKQCDEVRAEIEKSGYAPD